MNDEGRLQLIMPYAEGNVFIAEAAGYGLYCNNIIKDKTIAFKRNQKIDSDFQ